MGVKKYGFRDLRVVEKLWTLLFSPDQFLSIKFLLIFTQASLLNMGVPRLCPKKSTLLNYISFFFISILHASPFNHHFVLLKFFMELRPFSG